MKDHSRVKGRVTLIKRGSDGKEKIENHNIVTSQGDALLADLLCQSPSRNKVDQANGIIQLGTGWTGNDTKNNTGCNSPFSGGNRGLDTDYPRSKGAWGQADDNVVVYRCSFPAGTLNQEGIDEVALMNGAAGDCLAYAQITPVINMALTDSLQILWEISFLGS